MMRHHAVHSRASQAHFVRHDSSRRIRLAVFTFAITGTLTGCLGEFAIDADHLVCAPSAIRCDEICTEIAEDPNHCGECDRACDEDSICVEGDCVPAGDGDGDGDDDTTPEDGGDGDGDGDTGGECDPATGMNCAEDTTGGDCDPNTGENCPPDGSTAGTAGTADG